jgi:hypothetical protein
MITEEQLEQLAVQWFQDTGGENIEHRTPNIERRSEEKRRLAKAVSIPGSRQILRQSVARGLVDDRDMNRDIVPRCGGDLGGKWGIATEIPTMGLQAIPEETRATVKHFLRVRLERRLNP